MEGDRQIYKLKRRRNFIFGKKKNLIRKTQVKRANPKKED